MGLGGCMDGDHMGKKKVFRSLLHVCYLKRWVQCKYAINVPIEIIEEIFKVFYNADT